MPECRRATDSCDSCAGAGIGYLDIYTAHFPPVAARRPLLLTTDGSLSTAAAEANNQHGPGTILHFTDMVRINKFNPGE